MKRAALGLLSAAFFACFVVGCGGDDAGSDFSGEPKPAGSPTPGQNGGSSSSGGSSTGQNPNPSAQKAIEEADIIQLQDGHLFALSKSGTLSIIDVSKPGQLTLNSQVLLPGEPFEMYLNRSRLVLLMNDSKIDTVTAGSSVVLVLDIHDPVLVQRVGTFPVSGRISDSRLQGDLLYLVTESTVTTFDLTAPASLHQVDQLSLEAGHHSIIFGNGRLYVGGDKGIDLVDVSDAKGKLGKGTHVDTAGPITERWQMSEKDEVLRVVTQNPLEYPSIETFTVWNARSMQPMAKTTLTLPTPEELKAVRFDGDRAYFITFRQTDPLFIVDLAQPMEPKLRGSITIPGWIVHLEPRGNRLIGLGVDPSNAQGNINVSYFDVTNMDSPQMINRVSFGTGTNLAEDQDRLQKAFRIGADGLITVPYSAPTGQSCESGGAIQLVKIDNDTIYKGQTLPMAGNPRRALVNQNELLAVSDSNVSAFDIATASKTADVTIGKCEIRYNGAADTTRPPPPPPAYNGYERDYYDDVDNGPLGCSATTRGGSPSSWACIVGFGLVAGAIARRRGRDRMNP